MNVSWNEVPVPCIGQNGPITGYLLYYTNTTFNDTVNIIGGDNRQYILTGLTPYTNYTVTIRAYNDAGIGPTSNESIQQTVESGKYTCSARSWNLRNLEIALRILGILRLRTPTTQFQDCVTHLSNLKIA